MNHSWQPHPTRLDLWRCRRCLALRRSTGEGKGTFWFSPATLFKPLWLRYLNCSGRPHLSGFLRFGSPVVLFELARG